MDDFVELRKSITTWTLSYTDTKGTMHVIANFTNGPLQRRIMVQAARTVMADKMVDRFYVDADTLEIQALRAANPDMEDMTHELR